MWVYNLGSTNCFSLLPFFKIKKQTYESARIYVCVSSFQRLNRWTDFSKFGMNSVSFWATQSSEFLISYNLDNMADARSYDFGFTLHACSFCLYCCFIRLLDFRRNSIFIIHTVFINFSQYKD